MLRCHIRTQVQQRRVAQRLLVFMQGLHSRIQPLLIFFIDACNFLEDAETGEVDPRWEVYFAVGREGGHHIVVSQPAST